MTLGTFLPPFLLGSLVALLWVGSLFGVSAWMDRQEKKRMHDADGPHVAITVPLPPKEAIPPLSGSAIPSQAGRTSPDSCER